MYNKIFSCLIAFLSVINAFGANVKVSLTGLENDDSAILTISSAAYLATINAPQNGEYEFKSVPAGSHTVKVECESYNSSPAQQIVISEDNTISPATTIKLVLNKQTENQNEWSFKWEEDGSLAGYITTSHVNTPPEIEFLGKKIVPSAVNFSLVLQNDYHIYLVDNDVKWSQEYAYRLIETLKSIPVYYHGRKYAVFRLTDESLENDIVVIDNNDGYEVEISTDAFYYANPFLVDLDGVRGRFFSKRLHHALVNFVTNFGKDEDIAASILRNRYGCEIQYVDYVNLTKGITNEDENHFQKFFPSEIVSIINMLEELPDGFHSTPNLKYLVRRINGMPHPLYPTAAAVSWCVENGYIEFMESAFGGNNQDFETLRLILHEKTHFLWAFSFSDEIKNDWIEVGGWYQNPNASEGWSTTKDVEFVSAYSHAINPNEDMAESVAFYLKDPEKLMSRSPEKYWFICNRIMHGTRYISKIPDHLTFEVLNLFPDYDYPGKIKRINVTSTGAEDEDKFVTIEIEINHIEGFNDDASNAFVRINSPEFILSDGSTGQQIKDIWMYPVNGNSHILRGSTTISKYSKSGHWTAGDIEINDLQGNQRFEGQNDVVFDLVINNSLEDITPPTCEGNLKYTLTDKVVAGHQEQNLEVRVKIADNIGFRRVLFRLQLPGSTYSQDYDGYYDASTGEGIVNIPITEYYPEGDYYINHISLNDLAGNNIWYTFSRDKNDYPIQFIHIKTRNPDTNHPEIDLNRIYVYAEPTKPEAPDGETLVTISFYAKDDKSGFGLCNYRLRDPQGIDHFEYFYHRNFGSIYFDGDPSVWEHYTIKVILPKGSVPGIWGLAQMTVADKAFNQFTYDFVETLIFEPDESDDYVLFAEMTDKRTLSLAISSEDKTYYGFSYRIIHEDSGNEINGEFNVNNSDVFTRSNNEDDNDNLKIDVSSLPAGKLIVFVNVKDEDGKCVSVKSTSLYKEVSTGIESFEAVDSTKAFEVFDLNGIKVLHNFNELPNGIYIVRQGSSVRKIAVK